MMKSNLARMLRSTITAVAATALLGLVACSDQSPLNPSADTADSVVASMDKGKGNGKGKGLKDQREAAATYPQRANMVLDWKASDKEYDGGTMKVANGSMFHVDSASFTPPNNGRKPHYEISMKVDRDEENGELIYTFGPSGSKFDPPAEIRLDYRDLGIAGNRMPKLYYLKGNDRLEQTPDHVDVKNKKIILYVDHFSRYAVAH